jgi:hypothetical protein
MFFTLCYTAFLEQNPFPKSFIKSINYSLLLYLDVLVFSYTASIAGGGGRFYGLGLLS